MALKQYRTISTLIADFRVMNGSATEVITVCSFVHRVHRNAVNLYFHVTYSLGITVLTQHMPV